MKNQIKLIILLALFGSISACKKKATDPVPIVKASENPMASALVEVANSTFEMPNDYDNVGDHGFKFSPIVDGNITQLACKMPETGIYAVTLWEEYSNKPLRQKMVEQSTPGKLTYADIDPVKIIKDSKYFITVNNVSNGIVKKYLAIDGKNKEIVKFPKVFGNIIMISPAYKNNTYLPSYPDGNDGIIILFLMGLPDFTFIPN